MMNLFAGSFRVNLVVNLRSEGKRIHSVGEHIMSRSN